jgi:nucleotide-binding universal stress UspA family protein
MRRENQQLFGLFRPERHSASAPKPNLRAGRPSYPARGTILHPTDFSDASRRAFELTCRIAREQDSRLLLLHVAEPVYVSSLGMAPQPPLPKGYRGAWESRLRLMRPRDPSVRVEYRLEEGDVAAAILRVAREEQSGLIVMSGRERTRLGRLLAGSVTEVVEREAPCPVLRLYARRAGSAGRAAGDDSRGSDVIKTQAILHPTDFSQPARQGFEVACSLARASGSELVVAHVAPLSDLYCGSVYRDEVETELHRMVASAPTVQARWVLLGGDPATEILSMAREDWCDLVVMGARRRTGLRRLFGQRVTEEVMRKASRPVVTVSGPPGRPTTVRVQPPLARARPASDTDSDGGDHDFSANHPAPDELLALRR